MAVFSFRIWNTTPHAALALAVRGTIDKLFFNSARDYAGCALTATLCPALPAMRHRLASMWLHHLRMVHMLPMQGFAPHYHALLHAHAARVSAESVFFSAVIAAA